MTFERIVGKRFSRRAPHILLAVKQGVRDDLQRFGGVDGGKRHAR